MSCTLGKLPSTDMMQIVGGYSARLSHARDANDTSEALKVLNLLASIPMSAALLKHTKVGVEVNHRFFRTHASDDVRARSADLVRNWRDMVRTMPAGETRTADIASGSTAITCHGQSSSSPPRHSRHNADEAMNQLVVRNSPAKRKKESPPDLPSRIHLSKPPGIFPRRPASRATEASRSQNPRLAQTPHKKSFNSEKIAVSAYRKGLGGAIGERMRFRGFVARFGRTTDSSKKTTILLHNVVALQDTGVKAKRVWLLVGKQLKRQKSLSFEFKDFGREIQFDARVQWFKHKDQTRDLRLSHHTNIVVADAWDAAVRKWALGASQTFRVARSPKRPNGIWKREKFRRKLH